MDITRLSTEAIESAFSAELTRLESLSLNDEELEIARRYYSQKEREGMSSGSFCGPHRSFPITSQADVNNAAHLIGHADNPDAVKACIKRKAKANGWKLPASWTEKASRSMDTGQETFLYVPITRIDKDEWVVEGQATSDAVDHYNTVFEYDSSKRAFQAWRGNIREMHDPTKAVGRAIEVIPDDDNHAINVRARISRGARDTWEKVLDGTLSGFSIGVPKGKYKVKEVQRNGKSVPMYYDHELAEVSLVDNPGSPGCNIAVVRADGVATDVLDDTEEATPQETPEVTRDGQRISHATQGQLHSLRDGHLQQLQKTIAICICDECAALASMLDPDGDGDVDIVPSLDYDGDGGQPMNSNLAMSMEAAITRHMNPIITRVNAMLSSYASRAIPTYPQSPVEFSTEPLERRIADVERAFDSKLAEVRDLVRSVKETAEKIAATPLPGGPIATPVPVDKRLATTPVQNYNAQDDIAALQRAAQLTSDNDVQVGLAAEWLKRQQRG